MVELSPMCSCAVKAQGISRAAAPRRRPKPSFAASVSSVHFASEHCEQPLPFCTSGFRFQAVYTNKSCLRCEVCARDSLPLKGLIRRLSSHGQQVLPDEAVALNQPDMHRHSRFSKPNHRRSATLLILLAIAVCSLLAAHPVLKGRTRSFVGQAKQQTKLQSKPDDSQIARERAVRLGLVPAGRYPISKYDLVSAMPSDQTHLPVVKGSRAWRKVCFQYNCQQSTS